MSYILDALKKAENDHQSNGLYGRDEATAVNQHSRWWPALALMAVIINIALMAYIFTGREPSAETAGSSLASHDVAPPVQQAPTMAPVVPLQTTPPSAQPVKISRPTVPRPAVQPLAQEVDIVEHHARVNIETAPDAAAESEVPEVSGAMDNLQVDLRIPMLSEKSESFRQSLPEIKVDVHVYSDIPDKRFVLINMTRYHEGQELENGIIIHRITPHGLYLSYHDEHFQIAAQ